MEFKHGLAEETMSVPETAEFLNGSRQWVWKLIDEGQLESFKIGGKVYVSKASLKRLIAEQRAVPVDDIDLQAELKERRQSNHREKQGRHAVNQVAGRRLPQNDAA